MQPTSRVYDASAFAIAYLPRTQGMRRRGSSELTKLGAKRIAKTDGDGRGSRVSPDESGPATACSTYSEEH